MTHRVQLSNGKVLLVVEEDEAISLATEDDHPPVVEGEVGYWVCTLNADGILVFNSAGDATARLTDGLKAAADAADEEFEAAADRCAKELNETGTATYRGREIEDDEAGYTHNGSDFFGTLRECMDAIDREAS